MSKELIKITTNDKGEQLVSGRELHEGLKIEKAFSTWIQTQLENVDAVENVDFTTIWSDSFKEVVEFNGNTNSMTAKGYSIDYVLTLDIAKEICMCVGVAPRTNEETKKLSKEYRKYFINCEKKLKEVAQDQYKELSPELQAIFTLDKKQQAIEGRIDDLEGKMTIDTNLQYKLFELAKSKVLQELGGIDAPAYKELNRKVFAKIWRDYKRIMQVPSYKDTLVKDYEKGLEVLNNWTADKETKFMIIGCNSQINFKEDM